jgi:hypothetical protein
MYRILVSTNEQLTFSTSNSLSGQMHASKRTRLMSVVGVVHVKAAECLLDFSHARPARDEAIYVHMEA